MATEIVKSTSITNLDATPPLRGTHGVSHRYGPTKAHGICAVTSGVTAADTPINADHFASAVALAAVVTPTEYTFEAGTYLGADMELPLWNTASSGLSTDPGGFFDIVFTLTSTAGAAAIVNLEVEYDY